MSATVEFSIAALTDADVPAVVDLCREALDLPDDAAEADRIVARLREQPGIGFTATADGELAGVVLGSLSHRDDSIGHIDLVAVRPALRRQGIGRALLSRAEGRWPGGARSRCCWPATRRTTPGRVSTSGTRPRSARRTRSGTSRTAPPGT
ncbi:hypothetical protein Psuf_028460 [Phytohabitans suffuscus]|uniref:N-acetyltransferase domain-containing protein n=1 Tax=Phytohabitans suffuscus TaxID=624315 RepID=A0A6F8YHL7_9ACTN|nr:hypothetical protein Psuf_028460 [Phytohabitans suffuscus]